jgi:hypothetical protein
MIHLTPDMLINRAPHKPLSPLKVRRRGANAFVATVRRFYNDRRKDKCHDKKLPGDRACEQVASAFIKGWKDRDAGVAVTAERWQSYIETWTDREAHVEHLREAYINGRAFYEEQFKTKLAEAA